MTCTIPDCSEPVIALDLCDDHYRDHRARIPVSEGAARTRWTGYTKIDKTCEVNGCGKKCGKDRWCPKHKQRYYRHGDPEWEQPRVAHNRSTPETFWAKVTRRGPDDCWEWTKATDKRWGYGILSYQGKFWSAHRLAFFLTHGYLPEGDRMVCHTCDNPPCCNPAHLYDGTGTTNMVDMYTRGRGNRPTGPRHHMARVTTQQEAAIAWACAEAKAEQERRGLARVPRGSIATIAADFGINRATVVRIWKRHMT
jgi:hypothetical protein